MKIAMLTALLLATAVAAHADAVDDAFAGAGYAVVPCRDHDEAREKADHDLALKALQFLQEHDVASVDAMMPDLRAALDRAPDVAPKPERCGATLDVYSDNLADLLTASAIIARSPGLKGLSAGLRGAPPYGSLAFVIGWVEYEHKDFAAALRDYGRGRLNAPDDAALVTEYISTLNQLGRAQEALDSDDAFVAAHPALNDHDRAVLLRKRGYALVDLDRLDDAEAAYDQSLRLEPGDSQALADLEYIKRQRASHP